MLELIVYIFVYGTINKNIIISDSRTVILTVVIPIPLNIVII